MSKGKQILLVITLASIMVIVGFILNTTLKAVDPSPPEVQEGELDEWLYNLQNSNWVPDKRTKDLCLEEFGDSEIDGLQFQALSEKKEMNVILLSKAADFRGKVRKGDKVLNLEVDGFILDLWYSESEEGTYPTITIKGKEEKLFFIPEE